VDEMRVDAELRDACRPPRCTYVSAIRWKLQYYPDGVHPTADGHAAFARLVATALRQQQVG
jgi:lysophospholipase L1-like esterase